MGLPVVMEQERTLRRPPPVFVGFSCALHRDAPANVWRLEGPKLGRTVVRPALNVRFGSVTTDGPVLTHGSVRVTWLLGSQTAAHATIHVTATFGHDQPAAVRDVLVAMANRRRRPPESVPELFDHMRGTFPHALAALEAAIGAPSSR
jgi:hypothetical protein